MNSGFPVGVLLLPYGIFLECPFIRQHGVVEHLALLSETIRHLRTRNPTAERVVLLQNQRDV